MKQANKEAALYHNSIMFLCLRCSKLGSSTTDDSGTPDFEFIQTHVLYLIHVPVNPVEQFSSLTLLAVYLPSRQTCYR